MCSSSCLRKHNTSCILGRANSSGCVSRSCPLKNCRCMGHNNTLALACFEITLQHMEGWEAPYRALWKWRLTQLGAAQ